jgi:hypothetical protein
MTKPEKEEPPLEAGLRRALRAIDNQIAREMQRTPQKVDSHGVVKWEPIESRVELISSYLLSLFGEEIELDSLIVLSQAVIKTMSLISEDLGRDGFGEIRSAYIERALEKISRDCLSIKESLRNERNLN